MTGTRFGTDSMYPFCLVSTAQAAMGGVGINSWQASGPKVSNESERQNLSLNGHIPSWQLFPGQCFLNISFSYVNVPASHFWDEVVCYFDAQLQKLEQRWHIQVRRWLNSVSSTLMNPCLKEHRLSWRPTWTFFVLQARCTKYDSNCIKAERKWKHLFQNLCLKALCHCESITHPNISCWGFQYLYYCF